MSLKKERLTGLRRMELESSLSHFYCNQCHSLTKLRGGSSSLRSQAGSAGQVHVSQHLPKFIGVAIIIPEYTPAALFSAQKCAKKYLQIGHSIRRMLINGSRRHSDFSHQL